MRHIYLTLIFATIGLLPAAAQVTSNGTGGGNWNDDATWSSGSVPGPSETITILSGDVVTVPGGYTADVDGTLTNNGTLTISSVPFPPSQGLVTVSGTFENSGTISGESTTRLVFESGSTYDHQYTTSAGTIPTASWDVNSTVLISGYTTNGAAPAGLGQTFGNFTWNTPNQSTFIDLNGALTDVAGDLSFLSSPPYVSLTGSTALSLNVDGDFTVGSNFIVTNSANANLVIGGNMNWSAGNSLLGGDGDVDYDVAGNFTVSGGSHDIFGTGTHTINLAGDLALTGGSLTSSGGGEFIIIFDGSGTQNFSTGTTITATISYEVQSTVVFSGTPSISNLQVTSSGNLTLPSGTLTLTGNLQVNSLATFSPNGGTLRLSGTATQSISGGGQDFNNISIQKSSGIVNINSTVNMFGRMTFLSSSTATINSNGNLVVASSSDGASLNGSIGQLPTNVTIGGDVVVERYVSGEGRIWRYLSSPVSDANLDQWEDDFPITGTFDDPTTGTGIDSDSPSLYAYDESIGIVAAEGWYNYPSSGTLATSPIEVGRGYSPFIRADVNATTIDVTGTINRGTISMPVTYNSTAGGSENDGWNLVGNPYPSSINWDNVIGGATGVSFSGISNTIYIRENENENSDVLIWTGSGASSTLPSGVIATGQAFWVKATSTPTLTLAETVKTSTTGAFYREEKKEEDIMSLRITLASDASEDVAFVVFDENASDGLDQNMDAVDLERYSYDLATIADDVNLAVNYINSSLTCEQIIPINIRNISTAKSLSLSFSQLDLLNGNFDITLEDTYTNTTIDITSTAVYDFEVDPAVPSTFGAERFYLSVTSDLVNAQTELSVENSELCDTDMTSVTISNALNNVDYALLINDQEIGGNLEGTDMIFQVSSDQLIDGINLVEVSATTGICGSVILTKNVEINKSYLTTDQTVDYDAEICAAESAILTIGNSIPGVSYTAYYGSEEIGNVLSESETTTLNVTTDSFGASNDVTIIASREGCTSATLDQLVTINVTEAIDETLIVSGTEFICNASDAQIFVENAQSNVDYEVVIDGQSTGIVQSGAGSQLIFDISNSILSDGLSQITIKGSNNCETIDLEGNLNIEKASAIDLNLGVAGGGNVCDASEVSSVQILESQMNYVYQAYVDGVMNGDAIPGTGGDLFFDLAIGDLTFGEHEVTFTSSLDGCDTGQLTEGLVFSKIEPINTSINISGTEILCATDSESSISITTESGVDYDILNNGVSISESIVGNGESQTVLIDIANFNEGTNLITVSASKEGCESVTLDPVLNVEYDPFEASITTTADNQLISNSVEGNQWYYNGEIIDGAIEQTYVPTLNGEYSLIVERGGCSSKAEMSLIVTGTDEIFDLLEIYPNPTKNNWRVLNKSESALNDVRILNLQGKTLLNYDNVERGDVLQINSGGFKSGIYLLSLEHKGRIFNTRLIKH